MCPPLPLALHICNTQGAREQVCVQLRTVSSSAQGSHSGAGTVRTVGHASLCAGRADCMWSWFSPHRAVADFPTWCCWRCSIHPSASGLTRTTAGVLWCYGACSNGSGFRGREIAPGFPRARQGQATASSGFPSSLTPLPMWPGRCVGHLESFRTGCYARSSQATEHEAMCVSPEIGSAPLSCNNALKAQLPPESRGRQEPGRAFPVGKSGSGSKGFQSVAAPKD